MGITEHSTQVRVVQFMRTFYPDVLLCAIPNGANVNPVNRVRLVKEGLLAGMPDLMILEPRNGFAGMFIEFKKENGVMSAEQEKLIAALTQRNYFCIVSRHHLTAIKMIEDYLQIKKSTA